jgi:transposase
MKVSTISIDLAKNVFQVMGFTSTGKVAFNKRLNRAQLNHFMQMQPPCRVVMEACYSSHYWGRTFESMKHTVHLIPAQHVTPFVRGNKNDSNDTLAIFEASSRPFIRFVPIKTQAQQETLILHRLRERLLSARIAASNQLRGLLADFGIIFPLGKIAFNEKMQALSIDETLSATIAWLVKDVYTEYKSLALRIKAIEKQLKNDIEKNSLGQILLSIPGIGYLNASAFVASIGSGQAFSSAKDFAVWLGITPKQFASGNKSVMGGISKRGDQYLRKQLIHGARAIISHAGKKQDALSLWIMQLRARKTFNCTAVATAHKLARIMWTLLQKQCHYTPQVVKGVA